MTQLGKWWVRGGIGRLLNLHYFELLFPQKFRTYVGPSFILTAVKFDRFTKIPINLLSNYTRLSNKGSQKDEKVLNWFALQSSSISKVLL